MKRMSSKQIQSKNKLDKKRFANSIKRKAKRKFLRIQAEKLKVMWRRQERVM